MCGAQIQIRLGDSSRTLYSELHDGLQEGTPQADTAHQLLRERSAPKLWARIRLALAGRVSWNDALVALTRIAELREGAGADTARRYRARIAAGSLATPPGVDPADLLPPLRAIDLELARGRRGDAAMLSDLLPRVPRGDYDLADAWLFGRLGAGAADTVAGRFLAATDQGLRIRYLTLLSFSTDTGLIPLLGRIYSAPDSFGLPKRIAIRASDGLLWIGTRHSLETLRDARAAARARGVFADPSLNHADRDFLGADSLAALARTGRWIDDWLVRLGGP